LNDDHYLNDVNAENGVCDEYDDENDDCDGGEDVCDDVYDDEYDGALVQLFVLVVQHLVIVYSYWVLHECQKSQDRLDLIQFSHYNE